MLLKYVRKQHIVTIDQVALKFGDYSRECLFSLTTEEYLTVDTGSRELKLTYKGEAYLANERILMFNRVVSAAVGFLLGIVSGILINLFT